MQSVSREKGDVLEGYDIVLIFQIVFYVRKKIHVYWNNTQCKISQLYRVTIIVFTFH